MSMLNDRERHLLNDLEHQLEHEDPAWVRQFKDPQPTRRTRGVLEVTAIGLSVLLVALGLMLGIPSVVVIFGVATVVLARIRYRH